MRKINIILILLTITTLFLTGASYAQVPSPLSHPLIIDHTTTDLSQIPDEWIENAITNLRIYYVHASHGAQLMRGLERIESANPFYSVAITVGSLPNEEGALQIFDRGGDPINFWDYFCWGPGDCADGKALTREVLTSNPSINIAASSWCHEMNTASEEYVQDYLTSMGELEAEFPDVTFVYMTATADGWLRDDDNDGTFDGPNRHLRNEQIRQYCRDNNKVLFDFEDLDSWWFNPETMQWEHFTSTVNGHTISIVAPAFYESYSCGHMSYTACEQKGKAVWQMLARLAGWTPREVYRKLKVRRRPHHQGDH